jgi:hypothetical protein
MKASVLMFMSLTAMAILGCHSSGRQQTLNSKIDNTIQVVDERPKDAILSILNADSRSAILESQGHCLDPRTISYTFKITASGNEAGDTVQKLRDILGGNPNMHIAQDSEQIIRISTDDVSHDLLSVHMQRVNLSDEEQYNPNDALLALFDTPEVRDYMSQHKIGIAPQLNGLRSAPSSELPHMAAQIGNLTVEEYEARILQTFPGLIVYQECSLPDGHRLVSFQADRIAVKQKR